MKTTIYYAELSALYDEKLFRQYYLTLPACRREKIDALKPEGERCRSLGAGLLLKRACEEYGIPGEDAFLIKNEYGKPSFANRPEVHLSLSHSGSMAMCVISPYTVGCDIEKIKEFRWPVAKRVFTEDECFWISEEENCGTGDSAFCRLWTLKESFLKTAGLGFAFPVQEASFSFGEEGIRFRLHGVETASYRFFEVHTLPGYCAAVCLQEAPDSKPETAEISFGVDDT